MPDPDVGVKPKPIIVAVGADGLSERMASVVLRLAAADEGQGQAPTVTVVHVARVWGTGLGLQHPALQPNAGERGAAQEVAARAALDLGARGVAADALVISGRDVGKAVAGAARRAGAGAVVVGRSSAGRVSRLLRGPDPGRRLLDLSPCTVVVVE